MAYYVWRLRFIVWLDFVSYGEHEILLALARQPGEIVLQRALRLNLAPKSA